MPRTLPVLLFLSAAACSGEAADPVARGDYLVRICACADCHTPFRMGPKGPEPDPARHLSGHPAAMPIVAPPAAVEAPWNWHGTATNTAFAGPWGVSLAANLTPHLGTGLGTWSFEQFRAAMREGRHMGTGRPVLPPMPWPAYGQMTDDDLRAVYQYLRSLPPIENQVPMPLSPR